MSSSTSLHEKGTIAVQMENIFPIIKKWLYNDKEIFLRELISNGMDAMQKLRHLTVIGEAEKDDQELRIELKVDKEAKTLSIIDHGIGLTADEIKQYINQVAFSSASEFMQKYQKSEASGQIIGHFGLGFYSAFTVADKVEIHTRSYQKDAQPVIWRCDGSPNFEIEPGAHPQRGTEIRLYINKDEEEFLDDARIEHLVKKYCDFLPFAIDLDGEVINQQTPLWDRNPNEVTKEEYLEFYNYLYPFQPEPYLWVHLNVEVPFRLKGILFFPKLTHELDPNKGDIKLFCHNVYVSDHVEEFIPRFLVTLRGAVDCPDIPLNVSRSMLQNDPYVQKVSTYITKKVADRLKEMYNKDREQFIKSWQDIHVFVKVGMMEDDKFYDKVKNIILFKSSKGDYVTIEEYLARNPKQEQKVYYTSDEKAQAGYLEMFTAQGLEVLSMNTLIDTHFIQFLEYKNSDSKVRFARIDSDISDTLVETEKAKIVDPKTNKTSDDVISDLFQRELKQEKLTIRVEALKSEDVPALVLLPENMRRLQEMQQFMQNPEMQSLMPDEHTLVLNSNNPMIQNLRKLADRNDSTAHLLCEHVYDLAMMQHRPLLGEKLQRFLSNSAKVMGLMTERL